MVITVTVVESTVSPDLSCRDSKVNRLCQVNRDNSFQVDQVLAHIVKIQLEHMHQ
jgi:hypothetical protein